MKLGDKTMNYDVLIIGAGPGGIFSAYELTLRDPNLKIGVFEAGHPLNKRKCPINGTTVKSCIGCKSCSIMSGFGGAGAFSDGKYNITNDFGGTLYEYIGKKRALDLMHYVDEINMTYGGQGTKLYSTAGTKFKTICIQNDLHLLDASVRHLGTDINYVVLENLYAELKDKVDFHFDTPVRGISVIDGGYIIRGDNCYSDEKIPESAVFGVLKEYFRKNRHIDCATDEKYLRYAKRRVKNYRLRRFFVLPYLRCRTFASRLYHKIFKRKNGESE